MEPKRKAEMAHALNVRLRSGFFEGREVFLFGHCNATEEMVDFLLAHGVHPAAILDNSVSKQGLFYRGVPIAPPGNALNCESGNSVVLIATRFFADMSAQLGRLGYGGEIVKVAEYNSFAEYSLSDETLGQKLARLASGKKTLKQIRAQHPYRHLVVCPNNALGDVYWAMAFLPAYCKKNDIAGTATIVAGNTCCQVAGLFKTENIVALDTMAMDELVQTIIFTGEKNCIIAHHDRPYTDNIIRYLDKKFLSFIDYYRHGVYGLGAEAPAAPPAHLEPFENALGVPRGNSVILSPYAKSVVELPVAFWEALAADHAGRGHRVYTNTVGDEQPIRGTEALNVPIGQMISAAEHAGTFVGIRSGLCDVLHSANCQKTVVFPDCHYSTTPYKVKDFFALEGWAYTISHC